MPEVTDERTTLYFLWEEVNPDPVQYKPYSPKFRPVQMMVALDVPDRFIIAWDHLDNDSEYVVLTPEGMAWCAEQLSTGIARVKTQGASK